MCMHAELPLIVDVITYKKVYSDGDIWKYVGCV